MGNYNYVVKSDRIRNLALIEKDIIEVTRIVKPAETALVVDYTEIEDPTVTATSGLVYQRLLSVGFHTVVIKNHRYKDKLMEQPMIKLLMKRGQIKVEG